MIKEILNNQILINALILIGLIIARKVILVLFSKFIKNFFDGNKRDNPLNSAKAETISKALYSVARFLVTFIIVIIFLDMLGVKTGSILATAGIGGIAIAFGAQSIIQDFIKGMFLILDDMLRVGDYVECANVSGTVISVGLRVSTLRDYDGSIHTIPNSQIQNIKNYNRGPQRADVVFFLDYSVSLDEAKEIVDRVSKIVANDKDIANVFLEKPRFVEIGDFMEFSYQVKITSLVQQGRQYDVKRKIKEALKKELEEGKILINTMEKA